MGGGVEMYARREEIMELGAGVRIVGCGFQDYFWEEELSILFSFCIKT